MDKKQELENLTKELQEKINLFNTLEIQRQNLILEIRYIQGKIDLLNKMIQEEQNNDDNSTGCSQQS
jgi:hypothetical protein